MNFLPPPRVVGEFSHIELQVKFYFICCNVHMKYDLEMGMIHGEKYDNSSYHGVHSTRQNYSTSTHLEPQTTYEELTLF